MIKMKAGRFGLNVDGIVKGMDKNSPPFEATEEQEARLVKLGLAEYVGEPAPAAEGGEGVALEDMKADDLRALGKEYGLSFKVGTKKADMIEAIKAAQAEGGEDEDTDDDNPTDGEEDEGGEPAPTFDPSEAVQ